MVLINKLHSSMRGFNRLLKRVGRIQMKKLKRFRISWKSNRRRIWKNKIKLQSKSSRLRTLMMKYYRKIMSWPSLIQNCLSWRRSWQTTNLRARMIKVKFQNSKKCSIWKQERGRKLLDSLCIFNKNAIAFSKKFRRNCKSRWDRACLSKKINKT